MHPLFAYLRRFVPTLTEAEWQLLAGSVRPVHVARGQHFVQAGDYRPEIALLVQGSCRLYYLRPNGEERTTYFFFENHLLADYSGCLTAGRASSTFRRWPIPTCWSSTTRCYGGSTTSARPTSGLGG